MMRWSGLTRRQQIWSLKRQHDLIESLDHDAVTQDDLDDEARAAMARARTSTEPMDPESARMIEKAHGLTMGTLDPLRDLPPHEDIMDPVEPGVVYVMEPYVDDGRRVPSGPLVSGILRGLERGVDIPRIVRASGVPASIVQECMTGERISVPHAVMDRISTALEDDSIPVMASSTEAQPYLLLSDGPGGRRVVINARMDGERAGRIADAAGHRTIVSITPATGPSRNPVVLRIDATFPKEDADAVVAALMARNVAKRRL